MSNILKAENDVALTKQELWLVFKVLCVASTNAVTIGYDSAMMNGLLILPAFSDYFNLTTATTALNVSILFAGGAVAAPFCGRISDYCGRRWGMAITNIVSVIGATLQGAAQNEAMFLTGRCIMGVSLIMGAIAAPTYISEVMHPKHRVLVVGLYGTVTYIGTVIAALITFGTQYIDSTWAWRLPALLQFVPAFLSLLPLFFIPESPRWLIYNDRVQEAKDLLIKYHGGGNPESPIATTEYEEICQAIAYEKATESTDYKTIFMTKGNRWRFGVISIFAAILMLCGSNIISYYLGLILTNAGITSTQVQLAINIGLSIFNLICGILGSFYFNKVGRRPALLVCTVILGLILVIFTILSKLYGGDSSNNTAASSAMVFVIFLFLGVYSLVWSPASYIYPVEVLSYSVRANGMGWSNCFCYLAGLFITYVSPYGMEIPWVFYMINAIFCFAATGLMFVYFPETRGRTLEEIEVIFDGISLEAKAVEGIKMTIDEEKGLAMDGMGKMTEEKRDLNTI